jgi:response regulator RpfG family c-di-GMP phosphodiesterase
MNNDTGEFPMVPAAAAATVLIADDRAEDRSLLKLVLQRMGHRVLEAANGEQALKLARDERPDLVLSDILMPHMDGFELCRALQEDTNMRDIPFVFVTATYAEQRYQKLASDVGATRVLLKPFRAQALREVVQQTLADGARPETVVRPEPLDDRQFHERHAQAINWKLEEKVSELERTNAQLVASEARSRALTDAVVETITKMVEYRDPYTTGHEQRVGDLAAAIGSKLGYREEKLYGLRIGGYLHDVGKIAVPSELLTKPGRLAPNEYSLIQGHAQIGYDILSGIDFPWPVAEMARQHHERLDGSGYPRGLKGEEILPEVRILSVADVVEAMMSHRPYRPAIGLAEALREVERGRGTRYDPAVVDACLALFQQDGYQVT